MSDGLKEENGFRARLKKSYRLVILNYETFQELATYKLTMLNLYIAISSIIVIISLLVLSLVIFTPIKELIPGYGDIEKNTKFLKLQQDIQDLELTLVAQEEYNNKLRKLLTSDGSQSYSEPQQTNPITENQNVDIPSNTTPKDNIKENSNMSFENLFFTPPLKGAISASFKESDKHYGSDIIAPSNTPIKAIMDGIVMFSGWTLETGFTLGIQHSSNIVSFYKHNSSLLKEMGDYVRRGEAVAIIGNTGTLTDGPHLHFELWLNGKPRNPENYINFN
jgi:murein DD-endopeptidase MepM/ murein hydrolase activator NlpD